MSIVEKLNEIRLEAIEKMQSRLAVDVKMIMMRHFSSESHMLLNREAIERAKELKDNPGEGRSRFYTSSSGQPIEEILAGIKTRPSNEKKTEIVADKRDPVKEIVKENTYQAMHEMTDEELDKMFQTLKNEKDWLKVEGAEIHHKAGAESTRTRTREFLKSLLK